VHILEKGVSFVHTSLSVHPDITLIPSHSFKARELTFDSQTPHLNAGKDTEVIFEILTGAEIWGPWVAGYI